VQKTRKGVALSQKIGRDVQEDKYIKMQRYAIFISKMEQLARVEKRQEMNERRAEMSMQSAFMNSRNPIKDILYHYNKAATKGFDASLVNTTLNQLNQSFKGRGNKPRVYDDYSTREFDQSWRMHQLTGHIKLALSDELYFNHYFMAQTSRQLGELGHKDTEIIQKYFDKLNQMLDEREIDQRHRKPLDYERAVYGSYMNILPRHYIFDGFESN